MVAAPLHTPITVPSVLVTVLRALARAARFTGHFLLALVSVIFLGSGTEH